MTDWLESLVCAVEYEPTTGLILWRRRNDAPQGWNTKYAGMVAGSKTDQGYVSLRYKNKRIYAHRLAFACMSQPIPEMVDHINGCREDNRWENLRPANFEINSKNRTLTKSKNGLYGVVWVASRKCWEARISSRKNYIWLGHHKDFFEACCARKSAENRDGMFHENHGMR